MKNRAIRRNDTQRVVRNRVKEAKNSNRLYNDIEKLEKQAGRFKKRHPRDCGNTQCMVCHYGKVVGKKKIKQLKQDQRMKEMVNDTKINGITED